MGFLINCYRTYYLTIVAERVSENNSQRHECIAYYRAGRQRQLALSERFPATVEDVVAMDRIAQVGCLRVLGRRDRAVATDVIESESPSPACGSVR